MIPSTECAGAGNIFLVLKRCGTCLPKSGNRDGWSGRGSGRV